MMTTCQGINCRFHLRHEDGAAVSGDLLHTGKEVGDSIVGVYIRAKRDNGNDLGCAVLAIENLCLSEQLLALLLLEDAGGIAAVKSVGDAAGRLGLDGNTLDLAYIRR